MSNFHPGSWNVSWSIETILVGLLSFMLSEEITTGVPSSPSPSSPSPSSLPPPPTEFLPPTPGATKAPTAERRALAAASHAWNLAQPKFRTLFPEYAGKEVRDVPNMSGAAPKAAGPQGEGTA